MGDVRTTEAATSDDRRPGRRARRRAGVRRPEPALPGTWRGTLWIVVVAADFFLMSNPLVFVAGMDRALTIAAMVTGAALVATAPWVRAPRVSWTVLLFLGWLLLSYLWSIQPTYTAAAWAQTAVIAAVAAAVYANVSARVLGAGLVLGGAVVSAASFYAFHQRLPGAYYEPLAGPMMTGIGTNANILAYTLALALCAACAWVPRTVLGRCAWLAAVGAIAAGLWRSDSATGYLAAAAVVAVAVAWSTHERAMRMFGRSRRHILAVTMLACLVLAAAYVGIAAALGSSLLTFSDRTPLWSAALGVAQERPLLGFGYGAVWQHPWKPPLLNIVIGEIWDQTGTPLSHGHNSVVDLVVEVGWVGVALMVLVMLSAARSSARLARSSDNAPGDDKMMAKLIALCLVGLTVFGITEPMATIPLGFWVLVLLTGPRTTETGSGRPGWSVRRRVRRT